MAPAVILMVCGFASGLRPATIRGATPLPSTFRSAWVMGDVDVSKNSPRILVTAIGSKIPGENPLNASVLND